MPSFFLSPKSLSYLLAGPDIHLLLLNLYLQGFQYSNQALGCSSP